MNYPKIIGWILLIAGVFLIGWTLLSSYNIFTAKSDLPEFFEMPGEKIPINEGEATLEAQMEEMLRGQLEGILPAEAIIKFLNLAVWSMLAFILILGGSQISGLGVKLIKR